ncbi:unnamed protein product [Mycena citricolor]|uniref:Uncharacterized protein n=1 Tax=Mycena citricolor TaxID=2018698 RepID=A0AAD2H8G8_9AGAR|nr:unnamed protein product [Mycena citricolor]
MARPRVFVCIGRGFVIAYGSGRRLMCVKRKKTDLRGIARLGPQSQTDMTTELSFSSTASEAAAAFTAEIRGKNVLITGTSIDGIGFEAAKAIAPYANLVIITGYDAERLSLSEAAIKQHVPEANVRKLTLDLSSLSAVRTAAAEVNAYSEPIHVLVNNAAAAIAPFKLTVDGFENQIATAHLGPFLFTKLLFPKLLQSASATFTPRVVMVASNAHLFGKGVDFEHGLKRNPDESKHNVGLAYFQAKSANIMFARELAIRGEGKVLAFSLHPGVIMTNINKKDVTAPILQAVKILDAEGKPNTKDFNWKTIPQGAATTVTAAFDPSLKDKSGAYLNDCKVTATITNTEKLAPHTSSLDNSKKLWEITEELIGEKFET